jgi:DNA-binding transcriptional LysR family regulator
MPIKSHVDWDKLPVFHAVAESGSFTLAASKLGKSQSTISRQISSLETELGVTLFHRHARGLLLTEQGENFFNNIKDIFGKVAMAEAALQSSSDEPVGDLIIATTVAFGCNWLVPRIAEFSRRYPKVKPQFLFAEQEFDLSMREADFAITLWPPTQPSLIQRKFINVHNHVYASRSYVEEHGMPMLVEDLERHPFVIYGEQVISYLDQLNWLTTVGLARGEARLPHMRINNVYGIFKALESGMGIGMLPDYLAQSSDQLIRVLPDIEGPEIMTYISYPEELRMTPKVQVFKEFLLEQARDWSY